MIGITETSGGPGGHTRFMSTTNVQWLPPTRANIAQAMVVVPGYQRVAPGRPVAAAGPRDAGARPRPRP